MNDILCYKCNQEMERNPDADFPLPKNPDLWVRAYICPACSNTDAVLKVTIKAPIGDVVNRLEKVMGDIEQKGEVAFERKSSVGDGAEWDMMAKCSS